MQTLELVSTKRDRLEVPGFAGFQYSHHVNGVLATAVEMELNGNTIAKFASRQLSEPHFRKEMETVLQYVKEDTELWRHRIASAKANAIANAMVSIMCHRCMHINGFQRFIEFVQDEYQVAWQEDLVPAFAALDFKIRV